MSFFCQASRFVRPSRTLALTRIIDMSPGPTTYRSRAGFDFFNWKPTDTRSPDYISRRSGSSFLGGRRSPKKETVMEEVYGQLVRNVRDEIGGTHKGTVICNRICS